MRALPFVMIRRNVGPLLGCVAIFTALTLVSLPLHTTITEAMNVQDVPETTQTTFPASPGTLGAIPDGGVGAPPIYGLPLVISFPVTGVSAPITDVSVNLTLTHSWCGDLDMVLAAPGGSVSLVTVGHIGVTTVGGGGSSSDYNGTYNFTDTAAGANIWTAATASPIPAGNYRTTVRGMAGTTNPPAITSLNSTFGGLTAGQANGAWTLTIRDGNSSDTGTVTAANLTINSGGALAQKPPLDFDGDGRTDYAVTRDVSGTLAWYVQRSTAGFLGQSWGTTAGDWVVPGDYDGDGKWDIAVWRLGEPAIFYILKSSTATLQSVAFGQTGDNPAITQDFDGDGKTDPAVRRGVGGTFIWYILRSTLGFTAVSFGNSTTDVTIRGDYDGDGKADIAVYRTDTGTPANTFYVLRSSDGGVQGQTFGNFPTDFVLPADFDGDGKTDYAVWRGKGSGTSGTWYWLQSSDGGFRSLNFGLSIDFAVPGDYDGDGKSDQAVYRSSTPLTFYVNRSTLGFVAFPFGQPGDSPPGSSLQVR